MYILMLEMFQNTQMHAAMHRCTRSNWQMNAGRAEFVDHWNKGSVLKRLNRADLALDEESGEVLGY